MKVDLLSWRLMLFSSCLSPADTLYFFGDNNFTEWQSLFDHYESPPYVLPRTSGAYSFGIAGQFSLKVEQLCETRREEPDREVNSEPTSYRILQNWTFSLWTSELNFSFILVKLWNVLTSKYVIMDGQWRSRLQLHPQMCSLCSGPGTGVPFHWHGPGYSEVIYGRKVSTWLFFPSCLFLNLTNEHR